MSRLTRWLFPALISFIGASCVESPEIKVVKPDPTPTVTITGLHGVLLGNTITLSATTADGEDSGYTWAVLDGTVASIDEAGVVTALAGGETTVTATGKDTGAVGRHALVVAELPAELPVEVAITGTFGVYVGQTTPLSAATVNGTDSGYTWASLDTAVATVDENGVVTGVVVGETTVTATGKDSGVVGRHAIVVMPETAAPGPTVPYFERWKTSGHADKTAEAFKHWNADDPPMVPADCARCHSTPGYQDYIGEDGTPAGTVEAAVPVGTTVECVACHNATTANMDSVTFPSGVTIGGLGPEARCMTCHQGRASTDTVNAAIEAAAAATDDTPTNQLTFMNIHYYAAGATLYAGRARGGYQYEGKVYDWNFRHISSLNSCVECHDPHTLDVKVDTCGTCHAGVTQLSDLRSIRMMASKNQDYDGDGNYTEGIHFELEGLRNRLFAAIRAYTSGEGFGAVCYDAAVYPYWFKDTNDDGACTPDESTFPNRFVSWTARLVRASYNYQVSLKDPGAFAHNAKYIIQLLHDSLEDVAGAVGQPELLGNAIRNDFGHLNGASEAARHWDANEAVDQSCTKCHSGAEGFRFYLQYGVNKAAVAPDNGMECETCHDDIGGTYSLVNVPSVTFPGGTTLNTGDSLTNMCSTCHTGRESKATIDAAIAKGQLGFRNVHYLPAAGVLQGSAVKLGYEYAGKTYAGPWTTHPGGNTCNGCHSGKNTEHSFLPADNFAACKTCHQTADELSDIRLSVARRRDFDGDGSTTEPLADELAGLAAKLLTRMQEVVAFGGSGICYDEHVYPYFFIDTNGNGLCDGAAEATSANGFKAWTAGLMKAAHNYQIAKKDPGAWSHNFDYVAQLLYDSIVDLGGTPTGLIRP